MHDSVQSAAAGPDPVLCDLCGAAAPPASQLFSLVPDSSVIHPYDPEQDGLRRLVACGPDHLGELRQQYRQRPYVKEELWAGKIARALGSQPDLDEEELAEVTGLNFLQIERTLTWESERFLSDQTPPGEHERPGDAPGTTDDKGTG
ncbi:hypothetical protein [Streptomyces hygroscopicus]|uniref:hypothetical protein n=1 Tax=Streptomyces hygroscopicus TaxID=1912 RepID=UPI001FCB6213|nr:hypothetical protein [Streptomyces hygroscopicus]BDH12212.1 hypothetical protein HOK021_33910 [Streptomyces hygroscopicus]